MLAFVQVPDFGDSDRIVVLHLGSDHQGLPGLLYDLTTRRRFILIMFCHDTTQVTNRLSVISYKHRLCGIHNLDRANAPISVFIGGA